MFSVCLLPLRQSDGKERILCQNPATSSIFYCRPIRISLKKDYEKHAIEIDEIKSRH